jgi:tight adherence protein B
VSSAVANNLYYLFALLLFVAVVLLLEGAFLWWTNTRGAQAQRITDRLRLLSAGGHGSEARSVVMKRRELAESPWLQRALLQLPRVQQLDRQLERSGTHWSVSQLLLSTLLAGVAGAAVARLLHWPAWASFATFVAAAAVPLLYLRQRVHQRLLRLDAQLPGALDLMAQALRAGHAFPNALKLVGEEMAEPIGVEFGKTFDEVNFGISMKDALLNLTARAPVPDLRYFVIAVLIQRETGGNLAELLTGIASIIRSRHKLAGTIRVLSAEGKLSAWVLCLLPFAVAFVISIINPGFMNVLFTDPQGQRLLLSSAVMMIIGIVWTWRLIKLRV